MTKQPSTSIAAHVVAWLQRVNSQYANAVRWIALLGIIYGGVRGRADLVASFIGLAVAPNVVGKPQ